MNAKEAVASRIIELCNEKGIAIKLCDGLNITLRELFNTSMLDDIEQEIK